MKSLGVIVFLLAPLGLAGCAQPLFDDPVQAYAQRTDKVALSAGNDVAANEAIHTIDPWPRYAYDTTIPADGARMTKAVQLYEQGETADSKQQKKDADIGAAASGAASGAAAGAIGAAQSQ